MTVPSETSQRRNPLRGWRRTTKTTTTATYGAVAAAVIVLFVSVVALEASIATAFVPSPTAADCGRIQHQPLANFHRRPIQTNNLYNNNNNKQQQQRQQSTQLYSFMGSDGGILGIGTPELVRRRYGAFFVLFVCVYIDIIIIVCTSDGYDLIINCPSLLSLN